MKAAILVGLAVIFGASTGSADQCEELKKIEKEHGDWKLELRKVQTTPFISVDDRLEKYKILAKPAADRLEKVSKISNLKSHKTNIDILRKTMERIEKHEYTPKYAERELHNVLPNFEDDTTAAILNAQINKGCPDLGLQPGKPIGPVKSKR